MKVVYALGVVLVGVAGSAAYGQSMLGPAPYLSFSGNSPFAGPAFSSFYLENFEDGLFNTLGATPSSGWAVPPPQVLDSVDEDDGAVNGTGASAKSFYSSNTQSTITITFDALALGQLPTHAGLVWTDLGITNNGQPYGFGFVTFEAFGAGNVLLGTIGPTAVGEGLASGETAEDRFFGVTYAGGISAIRMTATSVDWEVDHVQYGIIPTTGTLSLIGVAGAIACRRRRA